MSHEVYFASYHQEYKKMSLKDTTEYSDAMEYFAQIDRGDHTSGRWYYDDIETLTIYEGSFGNYNSPGADGYTFANVFDDSEEYNTYLEKLHAIPEWID